MIKPNSKIKFIVGIDEAGRGPLAGPVSVGSVVISMNENKKKSKDKSKIKFDHPLFAEARDSKVLSAQKREILFKKMKKAQKEGSLDFCVSCVSAKIIDSKGISFAIRKAIRSNLKKLCVPPHETLILLDGSLYAPDHFIFQETIIRGDATVPIISLASIAAKVTRDRKMVRFARKYPEFDFEVHKGYGTFHHRQKIKKFGPSDIHRRSFLRGILG